MTREQVLAMIRSQKEEITKLKAELNDLEEEANKGPDKELLDLRMEIEELKEVQRQIECERMELPPDYRVPVYDPIDDKHHLYNGQRLFPPPTEEERLTGRIKVLKPEEFVCHPLPDEIPQQCDHQPIVLGRVTYYPKS